MKYYIVFVCFALASFNLKSNCFPSRATDNPCEDQPNGSFLTHPLGCKYFIVCNNGEVNMGSCPDGLAFNPSRPPCDLEENVNCDDLTTTPVTTTLSTTRTPATTTTLTTTATPTISVSTVASTTPATTTAAPTTPATTTTLETTIAPTTTTSEPTDATTSITSQTVTSSTTDPPTTTSTTRSPTPTTSTTLSTTTTITTTLSPTLTTTTPLPMSSSTTTTTTSIPDIPPEIRCPAQEDPNEIVFLASNSQCSKYYICYHNTPIEKTCSPNLHWNIKTQKCDSIEKAKCTVSTMPSFFPVCPRDAVGMYPHPLNCEWFLYCYHGHMTVQQCPFFYNWDSESQSCQLKTVAKCVLYSE